ncbi:hypothetical protein HanXRQr2_Chr09g0382121 [Helianthus annuus]|uniref:Uncharacterized protein n=1 Tax=Helianthus annuus TaxID=4232 RepID=A0A9K3I688_HELAN|nr:hypothetical protein HanXRQr2_Chr09g0382121 [Helianthus annuus]KAJ0892632.1 hypothetical protein HanPSC8_Chr09g0368181 [Helianthus annuus]
MTQTIKNRNWTEQNYLVRIPINYNIIVSAAPLLHRSVVNTCFNLHQIFKGNNHNQQKKLP